MQAWKVLMQHFSKKATQYTLPVSLNQHQITYNVINLGLLQLLGP